MAKNESAKDRHETTNCSDTIRREIINQLRNYNCIILDGGPHLPEIRRPVKGVKS